MVRLKEAYRNFRHNLRWMMHHDIEKENQMFLKEAVHVFEEYYRYSLSESKELPERLKILNPWETVQKLQENPRSFCRIGEGELEIIQGGGIMFQKADARLAHYLKLILEDASEDFYVGIPYIYFHSLDGTNPFSKEFFIFGSINYRKQFLKYCNKNSTYLDAAFTQLYINSSGLNLEEYFQEVKHLFKNRELVIFAGTGVFDHMDADVFSEARSKEIVKAPSRDAFDEFDQLLEKARSYSKEKLLCFILGPAAKALCYELNKEGYLAWDIGHLAKDYDAYCKKVPTSQENVIDFFRPD